jgi:hypothetical protein
MADQGPTIEAKDVGGLDESVQWFYVLLKGSNPERDDISPIRVRKRFVAHNLDVQMIFHVFI